MRVVKKMLASWTMAALCAGAGGPALAADKADGTWLAMAAPEAVSSTETVATAAPAAPEAAPEAAGWEKPIPVSFSVDYVVVSDYIWRGLNFSEYAGEGREKLNHQLTVGAEVELGKFGNVGFSTWFEWYAAQEKLTPDYGGNNQETDYTVYYNYTFEDLGMTAEVGWLAYTLPPIGGDAHTDYELYGKLSFDDSKWFGTKEAIFNPYVAYYHNLDLGKNTSYWEAGVSHDFALAELGCCDTPILKDMTITPSAVLGAQHRWYEALGLDDKPSTGLTNVTYGLAFNYDLSGALGMPEQYGSISLGTFLNYSQAIDDEVLNDEFFGGVSVSYAW